MGIKLTPLSDNIQPRIVLKGLVIEFTNDSSIDATSLIDRGVIEVQGCTFDRGGIELPPIKIRPGSKQ